jgi:hypothetical protein
MSYAACYVAAFGSDRLCPLAMSTSRGCSQASARPTRASTSSSQGVAAEMFGLLAADELDVAFCLVAGHIPDQPASHRLGQVEVIGLCPGSRAAGSRCRRRANSASTRSLRPAAARPSLPSSTRCSPTPDSHCTWLWRAATRSCCARSLPAASPPRSFLARLTPRRAPPSRCEACDPPFICPLLSSGDTCATLHRPCGHSSSSSAARLRAAARCLSRGGFEPRP